MEKTWVWPEAESHQWIVRFGGRFWMVWGCAPAQGVDHMCIIDRRIDAELHTSIHQVKFLAIVEFYGLDILSSPFNRIMTLKTPFRRLQNGSNRSRSLS